jgi:hypothetical protein
MSRIYLLAYQEGGCRESQLDNEDFKSGEEKEKGKERGI